MSNSFALASIRRLSALGYQTLACAVARICYGWSDQFPQSFKSRSIPNGRLFSLCQPSASHQHSPQSCNEVIPQYYGTTKKEASHRAVKSGLSKTDTDSGADAPTAQSGSLGYVGETSEQLSSSPGASGVRQTATANVDGDEPTSGDRAGDYRRQSVGEKKAGVGTPPSWRRIGAFLLVAGGLLISVATKGVFSEPDIINLVIPLFEFDIKPKVWFVRVEFHKIKEEPSLMRSLGKSEFVIYTPNNRQRKDGMARNLRVFSFSPKGGEITQLLKLHNVFTRHNCVPEPYTLKPTVSKNTEITLGSISTVSIENWDNIEAKLSRTGRGMPQILQGELYPYTNLGALFNKGAACYKINRDPRALGELQLFRDRFTGNPGLLQGEQQSSQPKESHYKSSSFNPQPLLIAALCALSAGLHLFWQARSFCWMMLGVLLMGAGWAYILLLI